MAPLVSQDEDDDGCPERHVGVDDEQEPPGAGREGLGTGNITPLYVSKHFLNKIQEKKENLVFFTEVKFICLSCYH